MKKENKTIPLEQDKKQENMPLEREKENKGTTIIGVEKVDDEFIRKAVLGKENKINENTLFPIREEKENKSLSELKTRGKKFKPDTYEAEDVKEKIQNVQRRLEKEILDLSILEKNKDLNVDGIVEKALNEIKKIFLEEIGRELI